MPPIWGSVFFQIYKNGRKIRDPVDVFIQSTREGWDIKDFESTIVRHVRSTRAFSPSRDAKVSEEMDQVENVDASGENPALPVTVIIQGFTVKFTKFVSDEELIAEEDRRHAEMIGQLRALYDQPAAAWPVGAGAGPAPAQPAPARRQVSQDPENEKEGDPENVDDSKQGGRKRTRKSKRRGKKRRYTRRR